MGKAHNPRRGSMQFWPRKRSRHQFVRVRSWAQDKVAKAQGFIAYKAGMTQVIVMNNLSKSITKGEKVSVPVTILDCPPMLVYGVSFYKNTSVGVKKIAQVLNKGESKDFKKIILRKVSDLKKQTKSVDDITGFDFLRLLVVSNPSKTSSGSKKPKMIELGVGGSKEEQISYAKSILGKELNLNDVFSSGNLVDVRAVTKGKGFQGVAKRYGVPLKHHKSEKGQRGIGNLGGWTPKRVDYRVAQPGKMGYHLRTEYNKQIVKTGENGDEINPKSGIQNYGLVKNNYLLIKGSVAGPKKRAILLTAAIRPSSKTNTAAPEINYISK